jgi:hypothetical protein
MLGVPAHWFRPQLYIPDNGCRSVRNGWFGAVTNRPWMTGKGANQPKPLRSRKSFNDAIGMSVIVPTLMVSISSAAISS